MILTTLIACVLLLAVPATSAWANAADDRILTDCSESPNGALRGTYAPDQLRHALRNMPGDFREYSACPDAIRQALLASVAGSGNSPSGGNGSGSPGGINATGSDSGGAGFDGGAGAGAAGPTPEAPPPADADRPLDVAGAAVAPGALPELGRNAHRLPTPLLVLLVLLGVAALVPAALTIGRRVVDHRRAK